MRQISTVIEIGTSKIVCIMSEKGQFDEPHILGSAVREYPGYKNRKWIDKKAIVPAILGALKEAQQKAGRRCKNVQIGIPADFVKVVCARESISYPKHKTITQADIEKLYKSARRKLTSREYSVLHVSPVTFKIDGARNTMQPVGQKAAKLSSLVSFTLAEKWLCSALSAALERKGYSVSTFIGASYAEAMHFISQEKRDGGAILLDIGDKSTCIMVAKGDGLIFHKILPFGGANITNDIINVLAVKPEMAEALKKRSIYGLSLAEDDKYEVCDKNTGKFERFSAILVQNIIEARLGEMLALVGYALESSSLNIPSYVPVFVSGGTASMRGIRELIQKKLGHNTQIIQPQSTCFNQPAYASALAVMQMGLDAVADEEIGFFENLKLFFER